MAFLPLLSDTLFCYKFQKVIAMKSANLFDKVALIFALFFLTACEQASKPVDSWEYAVRGIYSGAVSNDGSKAVVGSILHGGSLWSSSDGERLYNWNHKTDTQTEIIAAAFSPEGQFAITADHQTMVLWRADIGSALTFWTAPNEVLDVALAPNAQWALLGLADNSGVIFDVKRGGVKRTFYHDGRVNSVALSADGSLAVTGSADGSAKVWDTASGQLKHSFKHDDEVVSVAISADGSKVFTAAKYDKAAIWETQTGAMIGEFSLRPSALKRGVMFECARFSPDGSELLTGDVDRNVQLWRVSDLQQLAHWRLPKRELLKPSSAAVLAVGFKPRAGEYVVLASDGFGHLLKK